MASISSAGIGSGLDVNSIVTQLMAVEKAPLQKMQTEASTIQNKLSSYGKIQSYVSALRDAALTLTKPATWGDTTATPGDASVFTATTDSTATAASYSLSVSQLATAQTVASPASAFPVGAGRLRIESQGGISVNVSIDASDTAAQVRDKINAAKGGVTASVVTDTLGSRLVLRSNETGASNAFTVKEVVTDAQGVESLTTSGTLAKLTYDPATAASGGTMTESQPARNAKANINGLDVESASNLLSGVVTGVTIKLAKVSTTPVELTVASNNDSIKKAVSAFTDAYNNLNQYLADQTKYNAGTKTGATLQGDSGTNSLRYAMRGIMGSTSGVSGAFHRLSEIGIEPKSDGSLTLNSTKLGNALGKLSDVQALFANKDLTSSANSGFATQLQKWGDSLLSSDGAITTRNDSMQRQITANGKAQESFNNRMTSVEARIRAQYTALDTQMGKLNNLSSYMTQQITNMNKSSS